MITTHETRDINIITRIEKRETDIYDYYFYTATYINIKYAIYCYIYKIFLLVLHWCCPGTRTLSNDWEYRLKVRLGKTAISNQIIRAHCGNDLDLESWSQS